MLVRRTIHIENARCRLQMTRTRPFKMCAHKHLPCADIWGDKHSSCGEGLKEANAYTHLAHKDLIFMIFAFGGGGGGGVVLGRDRHEYPAIRPAYDHLESTGILEEI